MVGLSSSNRAPANHGPDSGILLALPDKVSWVSIDCFIGQELTWL
jgi:hypothetical protein